MHYVRQVCDANLSPDALVALARIAQQHQIPLWLEPTSVPKGAAAVSKLDLTYWAPNA